MHEALENSYKTVIRKPEEKKDHLEDEGGLYERIVLRYTSQKYDVKMWTGCILIRLGTDDGICLTR
jgi:hypothetical protein